MSLVSSLPALGLATVLAVPQAQSVALQASGTVAGKRVTFAGRGECHQTNDASIYNVPAAMWHAGFSGGTAGIENANVTLWQPKAGGPLQVTLFVDAGGKHYQIGTVKGGTMSGSGSGRVDRQGASGTLVVDGQAPGGVAIQLSISCTRFTAPEDNG